MGMITNTNLEEGLSFGPLPTALMIADPAYLIAHTTTDHLAELPTIHTNPKKLSEPIRLIEWICNVRCARYPDEQNIELIRLSRFGQSFYRTTRLISANEELLVWFRRQDLEPLLLDLLKIPSVRNSWLGYKLDNFDKREQLIGQISEDENSEPFTCSRCGAQFSYIYPYIAHHLFKCPVLFSIPYCGHENLKFEAPITTSGILNELDGNTMKNNFITSFDSETPLVNSSNVLESLSNSKVNLEQNTETSDRHFYPDTCYASSNRFNSQDTVPVKNYTTEDKCQIDSTKPIPKPLDFPTSELDLSLKGPHQSCSSISSIIASLQKKYALKPNSSKSIHIGYSKAMKPTNYAGLGYTHAQTRKSRSKSGLSSLKTRNPLVEQLLQTLVKKPDSLAVVDSTTSSNVNSGLVNLVLAQNWCARCSITFRLTSDLVHHMRTHHNQANTNHPSSSSSKLKRIVTVDGDRDEDLDEEDEHGEDSANVCQDNNNNNNNNNNNKVSLFAKHPTTHGSLRSKHSYKSEKLSPTSSSRLNCDLCGEVFREKHHLTRHMLSHS